MNVTVGRILENNQHPHSGNAIGERTQGQVFEFLQKRESDFRHQ